MAIFGVMVEFSLFGFGMANGALHCGMAWGKEQM